MTAFLDLFSGIGGFALGAYMAGLRFDKHYFSEIEDYAIKVYKRHFPNAENIGDIRNVNYSDLPRGEWLVTGGFPCQPHSDAGKKKGAEDERDLWPECRRMLCELRPRIALFENVRGLFTSPGGERKGEFFNGVLSDIHACGYDAEWQIISAADAGAPHLRKRVWIIAYSERKQDDQKRGNNERGRNTVGRDGKASFKNNGKADTDRTCGLRSNVSNAGEVGLQAQRAEQQTTGTAGICTPMADTNSAKLEGPWSTRGRRSKPTDSSDALADTESGREQDLQKCNNREEHWREAQIGHGAGTGRGSSTRNTAERIAIAGGTAAEISADVSYSDNPTPTRQREHGGEIYAVTKSKKFRECNSEEWWAIEPNVGRVADGIPFRVDRLKGIGNAIVPQCVEKIMLLPAFDRWREKTEQEDL